ncbi:MAG: NUDIX domain-containing protein, partial [Clostridia bacterium]|nr:NUDIX domain-containing protein [Clostridia bacterium]
MRRDLKFKLDDVWLQVRCGVVMRYEKQVVLEISTVGRNSVVPGGRVRAGEQSKNALLRELKEEMDFSAVEEKLRFRKVFENFFLYDGEEVHEIYFLYEYDLSQKEYEGLELSDNMDNDTTYFKY